jgi:xylose isomerase
MGIITGDREFFQGIGKIPFEGAESDNPLAYRWYNEDKVVAGKTMKEHLCLAVAYWHSFNGSGMDPFGSSTHFYGWDEKSDVIGRALLLLP